jgi:hypothetical protein
MLLCDIGVRKEGEFVEGAPVITKVQVAYAQKGMQGFTLLKMRDALADP